MNLRLFRLLKLHGLYCAPADDGTGGAASGQSQDDDGEQDDPHQDDDGGPNDETGLGVDQLEDEVDTGEDGEEGDEIVVTLGDEPAAEEEDQSRAPEWIRGLRKSNREKDHRIRELEKQVASATPAPQPVVLGPKPKAEDFNFDPEKYEQELDAWYTKKIQVDEAQRAQTQAAEQQQQKWASRIDAVGKAASALKVSDHDEAVQAFEDAFSPIQIGIVMGGPDEAKTTAALRYALGKNPKRAKELASITDPVKFAIALGKLETQLKVTPRKAAPAPERVIRSSVAGAAAIDKPLERMREEARRTGDYSKVTSYQREQREKSNKQKQTA